MSAGDESTRWSPELLERAASIRAIVFDIDGVMTDGTLFYRAMSEPETKPFNIKDGLGIKLLQRCVQPVFTYRCPCISL